MNKDEYFMDLALEEAKKSLKSGDVPVGAVVVVGGVVIAKAHNEKEKQRRIDAHAEILALKKANKKLFTNILEEVTLYVTCEPCMMCTGVILTSRVSKVVYGCKEPKFGCMGSILNVNDFEFNHKIDITSGVKEAEASKLLKDFFKDLRDKKKTKY